MYIAGIVSEYNPFHKGHEYHIRRTRERADGIVCVMSGNFTQRGDAAVFNKSARAECAVRGGADLVVELPLPWAMAPARTFARGAVGILAGLGVVDGLSFGSESGDIRRLESALYWSENPEIKPRLGELLGQGMTFAKARETAVREKAGDAADVLRTPNDTLALEYLGELARQGAGLQPLVVRRRGAAHDSGLAGDEYASASAVRALFGEGNPAAFSHMPETCAGVPKREIESGRGAVFLEERECLDENKENPASGAENPVNSQSAAGSGIIPAENYRASSAGLERAVISRLRGLSREAFAALPDLSEGLENRLYEAVGRGGSWRGICEAAKTKRYTMARIRRLLLSAALGITGEHSEGIPPYIKILALSERGSEMLRESGKKSSLPIITRASDIKQLDKRAGLIYDLECAAWDLYSLGYGTPAPRGENQRSRIFYYK